mgnify:CR=1 FL=1
MKFNVNLNCLKEDLDELYNLAVKSDASIDVAGIVYQLKEKFEEEEKRQQSLYEEFKAEYKSKKYRCSNTCPTWNPEDRDCEIYGSQHPRVWQCPYEFMDWKNRKIKEHEEKKIISNEELYSMVYDALLKLDDISDNFTRIKNNKSVPQSVRDELIFYFFRTIDSVSWSLKKMRLSLEIEDTKKDKEKNNG